MKKSKGKLEPKKGKKKEKDKKKKENKDGKKAALAKLLPTNEEDDDGWTQVGAGGQDDCRDRGHRPALDAVGGRAHDMDDPEGDCVSEGSWEGEPEVEPDREEKGSGEEPPPPDPVIQQPGVPGAGKSVAIACGNVTYWSRKLRRAFTRTMGPFDVWALVEHRQSTP